MAFIFSKKWFQEREQKKLAHLKQVAMDKMHQAAAKRDPKSIQKACEAVFIALHEGADLNSEDPVFKELIKDQMWARKMEHTCKTYKPLRRQIWHGFLMGGALIAGAVMGVVAGAAVTPFFTAALGTASMLGVSLAGLASGTVGAILGAGVGYLSTALVSNYMSKNIDANQYVWDRFVRRITDNENKGWGSFDIGNYISRHSVILGRSVQKKDAPASLRNVFQKQTFHPVGNGKKSGKTSRGVMPKWLAKFYQRQWAKKQASDRRRKAA